MTHICHLSSVHSRYDTRIFWKECRSLALHGYKVSFVVADGKGYELSDGVEIHDVKPPKGRLERVRLVPNRLLESAKKLDADIYHLHDPELLPIALKLKKSGKKVIFDSHEDVPKQILSKHYLNRPARWVLSKVFAIYERQICSKLDAVVAATPYIRNKFLGINSTTVDINNYPILGELSSTEMKWSGKQNSVCYVGALGRVRGVLEMVQAMAYVTTDVRLKLGGSFTDLVLEDTVRRDKGWSRVDALGWIDRGQVKKTLQSSVAGLVTLHPVINYLDSLPVKMFEYMSSGIPVIASDFPFWREIVEDAGCGVLVDSLCPKSIAHAIDFMVANPKEAESMGINGQRAVYAKYNWGIEESKLLRLYEGIASNL